MSEHLTFHNTDEQLDKGHRPTVLLDRPKSGEVVTATATGQYDEKTGLEYYGFVEGGEHKAKPLSLDSLSDQRQDELVKKLVPEHTPPSIEIGEREPAADVAVELGDVALAGVGVENPREAVDTYDHLYDLSNNLENASVEAAAVRAPESQEDIMNRERRKADLDALAHDAYMRAKGQE